MGTKQNPGIWDCYANARPDEEMFILLGRDRHASGLVRLWALMREKEGEPAEVIAEVQRCADNMEAQAREAGKVPMPLETLLSLAASLKTDAGEYDGDLGLPQAPPPEPLQEGQIVVAGRTGRPAKLIKIFAPDASEAVRGKANIMLPRAQVPTTVDVAALRRALPEEVATYRAAGGR